MITIHNIDGPRTRMAFQRVKVLRFRDFPFGRDYKDFGIASCSSRP